MRPFERVWLSIQSRYRDWLHLGMFDNMVNPLTPPHIIYPFNPIHIALRQLQGCGRAPGGRRRASHGATQTRPRPHPHPGTTRRTCWASAGSPGRACTRAPSARNGRADRRDTASAAYPAAAAACTLREPGGWGGRETLTSSLLELESGFTAGRAPGVSRSVYNSVRASTSSACASWVWGSAFCPSAAWTCTIFQHTTNDKLASRTHALCRYLGRYGIGCTLWGISQHAPLRRIILLLVRNSNSQYRL